MYASSIAMSLNASASIASTTKSGLAGGAAQFSQFSFMLQSAQSSLDTGGLTDAGQATQYIEQRFSQTIFYSLFGTAKSPSSGAVSGLLDSLGVGDVGGIDYSFHNGQYKTLQQVGRDFFNDFTSLTGTLGGLFGGLGVGTDGFSMKLDGLGHVVTEQGGTAAGKAEQLFGGSGTLVSRFAVMAARGAMVDAAESEPGFQQDYNEDPPGAIKKYIDALEERLFGFRLGYSANGFTATVNDNDVVAPAEEAAA